MVGAIVTGLFLAFLFSEDSGPSESPEVGLRRDGEEDEALYPEPEPNSAPSPKTPVEEGTMMDAGLNLDLDLAPVPVPVPVSRAEGRAGVEDEAALGTDRRIPSRGNVWRRSHSAARTSAARSASRTLAWVLEFGVILLASSRKRSLYRNAL
jgi:hypothetical protein